MHVSMLHVEFMQFFLDGLFWIYMGHVNWLMLDDQVNRFVGECWVSDVL